MHWFAHHHHSELGEVSAKQTQGLILRGGWRYDLIGWFCDTFLFGGKLRELRLRTANLAGIQVGEKCWMWAAAQERWRLQSRAALAERAASQALTQLHSRSPVPARKLLGATCRSISRLG